MLVYILKHAILIIKNSYITTVFYSREIARSHYKNGLEVSVYLKSGKRNKMK